MMPTFQLSVVFSAIIAASIFLGGCSRPLTDTIALSGEQTQRALVGYDETTYVYPVRVPGSTQTVRIITDKPLNYKPDYDDFLVWHATGKAPEKAPSPDN